MRVKFAEPTTSSAPTAWRIARWKLRSCWNTGRQSETRARKRVSNTAGGSRLYLYQGSAQVHPSPIKNVQPPVIGPFGTDLGVAVHRFRRATETAFPVV